MARRRARRMIPDAGAGLNLTPLLDIIFNLIFFFILATNIREQERFLEVSLPQASTAEERTVDQQIPEIILTREGEIYLGTQSMTPLELEAELVRLVGEERVTEVIVATDAQVTFQQFTDVTDIVRRAGIDLVTPRTRTREE